MYTLYLANVQTLHKVTANRALEALTGFLWHFKACAADRTPCQVELAEPQLDSLFDDRREHLFAPAYEATQPEQKAQLRMRIGRVRLLFSVSIHKETRLKVRQ